MISALLALLVFGFVGLVLVTVVMGVLGLAFGLAGFVLFKVAPVLLVGWVVMKLMQKGRCGHRRSLPSHDDQRWLDS